MQVAVKYHSNKDVLCYFNVVCTHGRYIPLGLLDSSYCSQLLSYNLPAATKMAFSLLLVPDSVLRNGGYIVIRIQDTEPIQKLNRYCKEWLRVIPLRLSF